MPEVTDAEIVAMVREMNLPLAVVVQRMIGGHEAKLAGLRSRLGELADAWEGVTREPRSDGATAYDRGLETCTSMLREVLGQSGQEGADADAEIPDEYGAAGAYKAAVEAILTVFDDDLPMTAAILDEDPGQLTAEAAALVRIREIGRTVMEGRWPPAKPPTKIPDTSVAGESMQDFDLLVTVRVYGAGSAMDAAGALCSGRGTFDLPGDGEVEIMSARPAVAGE